jgi:hypothetical protein
MGEIMIPTKPRKVVRITLTPDDHLENMPSFNRPKSPILKSEEQPTSDIRDKDGNIVPEPPKNNL